MNLHHATYWLLEPVFHHIFHCLLCHICDQVLDYCQFQHCHDTLLLLYFHWHNSNFNIIPSAWITFLCTKLCIRTITADGKISLSPFDDSSNQQWNFCNSVSWQLCVCKAHCYLLCFILSTGMHSVCNNHIYDL